MPPIVCLGAGRMGRGIAIAFAYAGQETVLLDVKPRPEAEFHALAQTAKTDIETTLASLAAIGLFPPEAAARLAARITIAPETSEALPAADLIFEAVPELPALKRETLARLSPRTRPDAIIASTTSTILPDDIAQAVIHPERFLNAHWLNPAYLIPLVEIAPGTATSPEITATLRARLTAIGKKPITCAASPGYIVPRIQALAMNEAARMVGEGVASAADLDAAIRYGFGVRFAILGLIEFIDWGGGDILHHASRYLAETLNDPRYAAPPIIAENMAQGRIGLSTGQGFYDYANIDIPAYRQDRLARFADLLKSLSLLPPPVL